MNTLCPKVTRKVLDDADRANAQQQIAISKATGALSAVVAKTNRSNCANLLLAGVLTSTLGDSSAFRRKHNEQYAADFDSLCRFLAAHPDREFVLLREQVE